MKTPDKIKKGLAVYPSAKVKELLQGKGFIYSQEKLHASAFALIQQLEAQNAELKRERDAAISELPHNCWNCKYHLNEPIEETDDYGRTIHRYCDADVCYPDEENSSWEWRGPCKENGGVVK